MPQPGVPQPGWQQQQPGMPPGGWAPQQMQQAPKKRRKWPWILLASFLLMVVGIGGCSAYIWKSISGITDTGNEFVSALNVSGAEAAAKGCPGSFTVEELDGLRTDLVNNGWTGGKSLLSSNVSNNNGAESAVVSGTLATTTPTPVDLILAKSGGKWCVERANLGSAATGSGSSGTGSPDFTIPDISIPDISIPDITVPAGAVGFS